MFKFDINITASKLLGFLIFGAGLYYGIIKANNNTMTECFMYSTILVSGKTITNTILRKGKNGTV